MVTVRGAAKAWAAKGSTSARLMRTAESCMMAVKSEVGLTSEECEMQKNVNGQLGRAWGTYKSPSTQLYLFAKCGRRKRENE